ncbi:MAG TPA: hypothetical protein VMB52_06210 [Verrucomicrobiae bacterium]|nr:hypothetical protein [Verrucomicrobiae bacterium]
MKRPRLPRASFTWIITFGVAVMVTGLMLPSHKASAGSCSPSGAPSYDAIGYLHGGDYSCTVYDTSTVFPDVDPGHFSTGNASSLGAFETAVESSSAADFYIDIMLGNNPSSGHGNSSPDISLWKEEMADDGLAVSVDNAVWDNYNSAANLSSTDYFRFELSSSSVTQVQSLKLYDASDPSKVYLYIKIDCGNVVGTPISLPNPSWNLSSQTRVDIPTNGSTPSQTVKQGDAVVFSSIISNPSSSGGTASFAYGPRYFYSNEPYGALGSDGTYHGVLGGTGEISTNANRNDTLAPGDSIAWPVPYSSSDTACEHACQLWQRITNVGTGADSSYQYICGTAAYSPYDSEGDTIATVGHGRSTPVCVAIDNVPTGSISASCTEVSGTPEYVITASWGDADGGTDGRLFDTNGHWVPIQSGPSQSSAPKDGHTNVGVTSATWSVDASDASPGLWPLDVRVSDAIPYASGSSTATVLGSDGDAYFKPLNLDTSATPPTCPPVVTITPISCTNVTLTMSDPGNPSATFKYYWKINSTRVPASPGTYPFPDGKTSEDVSGFTVSGTNPFNYWGSNTVTVYAETNPSSPFESASATLKPCATLSCSGVHMVGTPVPGENNSFQFYVDVGVTGGPPAPLPAGNKLTVTVTDPNGHAVTGISVGSGTATNPTAYTNPPNPPPASNIPNGSTVTDIYSAIESFTPVAGTYAITYNYPGNWSASSPSPCPGGDKVGYEPYFSVQGGDVAAGAGYGSCSVTTASIRGSNTDAALAPTPQYAGASAQLGAFANGTGSIKDFVTGTGLANAPPPIALLGHGLSFANDTSIYPHSPSPVAPPTYGTGYGSLPCQEDYYGTPPASNVTVHSEPGSTSQVLYTDSMWSTTGANAYQYSPTTQSVSTLPTPADTLTLGATADDTKSATNTITISANAQISMYVKGNVYITDNIKYAGYNLTNVPRFNLYVDGNVYISPYVHYLEGVYVAQECTTAAGPSVCTGTATPATTGILNTCTDSSGTETYSTCNITNSGDPFSLRVIGAASAQNELQLARTYGNIVTATGAPAQPAEVFEYSPELWLTAGTPSIDAYTGLPPVL